MNLTPVSATIRLKNSCPPSSVAAPITIPLDQDLAIPDTTVETPNLAVTSLILDVSPDPVNIANSNLQDKTQTTFAEKSSDESIEATDAPKGVQDATTTNTGPVNAEVTKVAKAKSAGKKGVYQTSPGSSIAKNKPKRACTLRRTIPGQPMVEASQKVSMKSSAPQKQMSDFFPKK